MTMMAMPYILALAALAATPAEVRTILEPPETPFHRPALFTVEVEVSTDADVRIPTLDVGVDGIEVRDGAFESMALDETRKVVRQSFLLDPIDVGTYRIPPIEVALGVEETLSTQPMALLVRDLTDAEKEAAGRFEDIVGPPVLSTVGGTVLKWSIGVAIAAAIAAGILWLVLRKREVPAAPPLKPWEVADRRLAELARRKLPEKGAYDAYYVDLSAILRYYIEDRYHVHAPELTTPELLHAVVAGSILGEQHQDFLAKFLRHCDYVKFAQYRPSSEEMDGGFRTVRQFVFDTIPKAAVQSETDARTEAA